MPYESEKQRRYMYAQHPEIAKRREREGTNYVKRSSKRRSTRGSKRR